MKRTRIAAALVISASFALISVGAQAASTDLSADVVVFVDGGANGTVVLTGSIDISDDQLQNPEATQVRAIIAPSGELDLANPMDLLDPNNRPDCGCLLVGDFTPDQDLSGSFPDHYVFHSTWRVGEPDFSFIEPRLAAPGSPQAGSVANSAWLLGGEDGQAGN